jgi:hypothetical protein
LVILIASLVSISTAAAALQVETLQSENITTESFDALGNITELNDAEANASIQYRESGLTEWNVTGNVTLTNESTFNWTVSGLDSGTEYEFRAKASNSTDTVYGSVLQVNTTALKTVGGGTESFSSDSLTLNTLDTTSVGVDWLRFNGSVSNFGPVDDPVAFNFSYRKQGSSTWNNVTAEMKTSSGTFTERVDGLDTDATYEYRAVVRDEKASIRTKNTTRLKTSSGTSRSFSTKSMNVTTLDTTSLGVDWIRFNGSVSSFGPVDDPVSFKFRYRKKGSSTWNEVLAENRTTSGTFTERVNGLENGTTYEYEAFARSSNGSIKEKQTLPGLITNSGSVQSFFTGTIFNITVNQVENPLQGDNATFNLSINNTGDASGTENITVDIPGFNTVNKSLNLDPDQVEEIQVEVPTSIGDSGNYTVNISSERNHTTTNLSIWKLMPPHSPEPSDSADIVGLNENLTVEANSTGNLTMNIEFFLNESDNVTFIGSDMASTGNNATTSLSQVDLDPGTDYDWFATASLSNNSVNSTEWGFNTVERPEVNPSFTEPSNQSLDTGDNPFLNVTVSGEAPINITLHDYEKASSSSFYDEEASPGGNISYNLSKYEGMGEGITERWWVELESKGAVWNNSDNPYEFTTTEIKNIDFQLQNFESGENLNPGVYGGLDDVIGQEVLRFKVSNDQNAPMDIEFNISDGVRSNTTGYEANVESGETVLVNISDSNIVWENSQNMQVQAFYKEGQQNYMGDNFTSEEINFTTYVAELEWNSENPDRTDEFRIYYNETASGNYTLVGDTNAGNTNIGVANKNLDSASSKDCYSVKAWNEVGGLSDYAENESSESNCLGSDRP